MNLFQHYTHPSRFPLYLHLHFIRRSVLRDTVERHFFLIFFWTKYLAPSSEHILQYTRLDFKQRMSSFCTRSSVFSKAFSKCLQSSTRNPFKNAFKHYLQVFVHLTSSHRMWNLLQRQLEVIVVHLFHISFLFSFFFLFYWPVTFRSSFKLQVQSPTTQTSRTAGNFPTDWTK